MTSGVPLYGLVQGARELAIGWHVHPPDDDLEVRDVEDFRWHGAALPAELEPHLNMTLNPSGEMPSEEEFELAMANRKARLEKK